MKYIIRDWTGKVCFHGIEFNSFEDGYDWLTLKIEELYPDTVENDERLSEEIGEYYVEPQDTAKG